MHPRRLLPLLVLALLLGVQVPSALAQDVVLALDAVPPTATVEPGTEAATTLQVHNNGPLPLRVNLSHDATSLHVFLERTAFTVEPNGMEEVRARVWAPGLANGSRVVNFRAVGASDGPVPAPDQEATALFTLHVRSAADGGRPSSPNATEGSRPDPFPDRTGNGTAGGGDGNGSDAPANRTTPPNGTGDATTGGTQDGAADNSNNSNNTNNNGNAIDAGAADADAGSLGNASGTEPPTPPAPVVAPEWLELRAAPRERVPFEVEGRNPGPRAQGFEAILRLPLGWAGTLQRNAFDVPAGGSVLLQGSVLPLADAPEGEASLAVSGPGGTAVAVLRLHVERPDGAAGAGEAAALERQGAAAQDEPARDGNAAAATTPPPAARGILALRVEPEEVRVPRGGRALAHLVVENGLAIPLDARPLLAAPDGFRLDPAGARVEAGATLRIPLVLHADDTLEEGTRADATVYLDGHDAQAAPVRLLVDPAEPKPSSDAPPAPGTMQERADAPLVVALALAAAGGVALCAAWAWRRWHLGVFALYARLLPSRVLEHPKRRAIMDVVTREPGVRLADLQRGLGLANGALRHHVDRLEAAGHLRSVPEGPHRRLYPPAAAGKVAPTPGLAERALRLVDERGPVAASELAAALGVSRQALHYHLKKLAAQGRIRAVKRGNDLVLDAPERQRAGPAPVVPAAAPRGGPRGPSP